MSLFSTVHHIAIVVRNIEEKVEYYEGLGIGPWSDMDLHSYSQFDVPNRDGFLGLTFKRADVGNMQIQLVQPGEGSSPERDFLEAKGEGVFHLGFEVENIAESDLRVAELGIPIFSQARRPDGSGFSYLDNRESAGVMLELRQSPSTP